MRASASQKLHLADTNLASASEDDFISETGVVVQALSLLQGLVFLHGPSKDYLGRKASLKVRSCGVLVSEYSIAHSLL